jgi:ribosomal protein S18 acetylase RimI-like enzyme
LQFVSSHHLAESAASQLAAIYESSFAPAEREPIGDLLKSVADGSRVCYLGQDGNTVVAFGIVYPLPGGIRFLEYFAVDAAHRNRHIGSDLFDHLLRDPAARASPGVVFEVEDPALSTGVETEKRLARIRFYRRLGADIVACAPAYQAPSSIGGDPLRYLLMWSATDSRMRTLEGERLRNCVREILVTDYGLSEDDPLVVSVVEALRC